MKTIFLLYNNYGDDMKFNKLIPELSVSDLTKSTKFYTDLGFKIMYERPNNKFCFIEYEGNQLMLEQNNDHWDTGAIMEYPYGRGINISMEVTNIELIRTRALNCGYKIFIDIMVNEYQVNDKCYQDREFLIQDPDGYVLRFND